MNTVADSPDLKASRASQREPLLEAFAPIEAAAATRREPAWVFPLRKAGLARFADEGWPTSQDEDWRFTNLAPLAAMPLRPALRAEPGSVSRADLERRPLASLADHRLVFVDGHFAPGLSRLGALPQPVQVSSLDEALRADPAWLEPHLGRPAGGQDRAFLALNDAFFTDGVVVRVPAGVTLAEPIHAIFVSTAAEPGGVTHPRNLVVAEANAQVTVLEHYLSLGEAPALTNTVTQLLAGEGAQVEHLRFQDQGQTAFHVGALRAIVGRSARVTAHSFALGSRLSRQNLQMILNGPGLEAVLNGLYVTTGSRLADHHMVVDHAQPHGASHEYFNGILSGQSRGVFHGRILVRPGAQKTDAKQTNKNLLLSDGATVNTKPQLEIYADDVKCTHGATIGQLHPESVFYLRARGLPLEIARRMLIHAFAGEIIDRVRCASIRQALDRLVWDRLEREERVHLDGQLADAPHV